MTDKKKIEVTEIVFNINDDKVNVQRTSQTGCALHLLPLSALKDLQEHITKVTAFVESKNSGC